MLHMVYLQIQILPLPLQLAMKSTQIELSYKNIFKNYYSNNNNLQVYILKYIIRLLLLITVPSYKIYFRYCVAILQSNLAIS